MGVAFPAQGASGRQPGCCSLQEKTDKLRREVEKWGWPGRHGVLLGQPCARGFLDLLPSFPTAVQEAGMRCPGLTAKKMAQSSTVTCPGLHSWHLTFHLCDSEAQASFWDALPLSSSLWKWGKLTKGGNLLAFCALKGRGQPACAMGNGPGLWAFLILP